MMSIASLHGMSNDQALELIAKLTDISIDLQTIDGAKHAVKLSDELQERDLTAVQTASLYYYLANAWAHVRTLSRRGKDLSWDWEQDELDKEILFLRKAMQSDGVQQLSDETACSILTNLGNLFDHVGRFVEAIEYWDRALAISPSFAMARGNKGFGLFCYAGSLYDPGHRILLLKAAHRDLKTALTFQLDNEAKTQFAELKTKIESKLPGDYLSQKNPLINVPVESSDLEEQYRIVNGALLIDSF